MSVQANTDGLEWWGVDVGHMIFPLPLAFFTSLVVQFNTTILVNVQPETKNLGILPYSCNKWAFTGANNLEV